MIIGFGFGGPLTALLMLVVTSLVSYSIYRLFTRNRYSRNPLQRREELRRYYLEQRELARRMSHEFDLTDEEIEDKVEKELRR